MNQRASAVGPPADRRAGRFPLEVAERIAAAVVERLAPHAEKIVVAGSIRRRRPDVGDIDLVAIPKLEQVTTGLFTTETQRPRDSRLAVEFCALTGKLLARGDSIIRGFLNLEGLVSLGVAGARWFPYPDSISIGIDLFLCTPETWATTLLIRTGSAEHNIWLCQRARALGGKLHADGSGLDLPGEYDIRQQTQQLCRFLPESESQVFFELLFPPKSAPDKTVFPAPTRWNITGEGVGIPPELREIVNGKPVWLSGKTNADERREGN